jgi:hypothetical protein
MRTTSIRLLSLVATLLLPSLVACNALDSITGEDDENEVRVQITQLGADFLVADDGYTYQVDGKTEYEGAGLSGFADLAVSDIVEIEYRAIDGDTRYAEEIESGAHDDSGDDD